MHKNYKEFFLNRNNYEKGIFPEREKFARKFLVVLLSYAYMYIIVYYGIIYIKITLS